MAKCKITKIPPSNMLFSLSAALLLCASTILPGCSAPSPASPPGETWTSLFNGCDFSGWTVKCKPADRDRQFWHVRDGTILADSIGHTDHNYIWLLTDNQYSNFILRLRFQAYTDSPGNSGVQIRSRYDDDASWLDGPQIDINPPGPWRTGMIWDETRQVNRWLYPDLPKDEWVDESMADPGLIFHYSDQASGWNDLQITAVGNRISAVLNGVTVTNYDGRGVLDDAIHQHHNVGRSGHIALQIHKNDQLKIRFKDIFIKELPK
ncbi:MAG: DUF1080 domain-containing protein [Planctomycetota bacterium]|nr:MAG: DUF1080 domain-containing protein [Planctomycetota bacterium]